MRTRNSQTKINSYRPEPIVYVNLLKTRVKENFSNKHFRHCELRWAAMYCCDETFNISVLIRRTPLHIHNVRKFLSHYGIDINRRDLIQKENN